MSNSLRASQEALDDLIDPARIRKRWNKHDEEWAEAAEVSLKTLQRFWSKEPIRRANFIAICQAVGIEDWKIIAGSHQTSIERKALNASTSTSISADINIDDLVKQVRVARSSRIECQCGKMRMLYVSQAVNLADIYTEVNVLKQPLHQKWRNIDDFFANFDPDSDSFDRLGLGKISHKRVSGFDAVSQYSRLMVLGKPGCGKTTFLQWVAVKSNSGEIKADKVPIFIRLKDFAESKKVSEAEGLDIHDYILKDFLKSNILDNTAIESILVEGRALILLDGLDEVLDAYDEAVTFSIRSFMDKYFENDFIITCRIATQKYMFLNENFTEVEVADFNQNQVDTFSRKWFLAVDHDQPTNALKTAKLFVKKLNQRVNKPG